MLAFQRSRHHLLSNFHLVLIVFSLDTFFYFFGFEETSPPRKAYFVGSGEEVKPRLSQALTRNTHPDSNSKPVVPGSCLTLLSLMYFFFYLIPASNASIIFNVGIYYYLHSFVHQIHQ
jgi:hypothetical protein